MKPERNSSTQEGDNMADGVYIKHHGIKGQKWGVRRFQNKDGSLTNAGERRYNKSVRQMKLEDKYVKRGLSKSDAEKKAKKRVNIERFMMAAAATTVVAAIAYKKHVDNGKDFVIKNDTTLQRIISLEKGKDVVKGNREYMSFGKMDNMKYKGMMGVFEGGKVKSQNKILEERMKLNPNKSYPNFREMYKMTITPKKDIKVASVKRSKDTFFELYKNDASFKKAYDDYMVEFTKNYPKGSHSSFKQFADAVKKGKVDDNFIKNVGYKSFNIAIAERDNKALSIQNRFYDALKKQGMNAIVDLNDKKGMLKSSKPIIAFDMDYDYSKKVLTDKEIKKNLAMAVPTIIAQNTAKPLAMAFVAGYGLNRMKTNNNANKLINEYKKEHPNSELTDKEILDLMRQV